MLVLIDFNFYRDKEVSCEILQRRSEVKIIYVAEEGLAMSVKSLHDVWNFITYLWLERIAAPKNCYMYEGGFFKVICVNGVATMKNILIEDPFEKASSIVAYGELSSLSQLAKMMAMRSILYIKLDRTSRRLIASGKDLAKLLRKIQEAGLSDSKCNTSVIVRPIEDIYAPDVLKVIRL